MPCRFKAVNRSYLTIEQKRRPSAGLAAFNENGGHQMAKRGARAMVQIAQFRARLPHCANAGHRFFPMYIVAIAWLYVVLMMSLTEQSWVAGIGTFVFYGVAPLSLFLWIVSTPARRRRRKAQEAAQDKADTTATLSSDTGDGAA